MLTKQSIDRPSKNNNKIKNQQIGSTKPERKKTRSNHRVIEDIPKYVVNKVVEEVLSLVGDSNWNDPLQVSASIAKIMSIDSTQPIEEWTKQPVVAVEIDRTVLVQARDRKSAEGESIPFWICQSLIRVDEKKGYRYIEYNGSKYNKIDVIFKSKYFKERMDKVAKYAHCSWNARWGNSNNSETRLYQKTRPGEESWLDKCVAPLLKPGEKNGINIKDLIMIEFKRELKPEGEAKEPEDNGICEEAIVDEIEEVEDVEE